MKKILIATTAAILASTAAAQSSVTMFGIVDMGVTHAKGSLSKRTMLSNGGNQSSRIGFRGTENLGGGLAASFWLEAQLNDDGTGSPTNTNNQASGGALAGLGGGQGLVFNRRSTVSLTGGWGEVRLGRDIVGTFANIVMADPFGYVGVGTTILGARAIPATQTVVQVRGSNMIGYYTPSGLGGLYGSIQRYMGENQQNGAATEDDGNGWVVRLGYAAGPLNVAVGNNRINLTNAAGLDVDVNSSNIAATYSFGVARLVGVYQWDKQKNVSKGSGGTIGVVVPAGVGEFKGTYSRYTVDNNAVAAQDPRASKIALGYVHNLSKRTVLYTTVARLKNAGGSALSLAGTTTAANTSATGFDIGMRHSF